MYTTTVILRYLRYVFNPSIIMVVGRGRLGMGYEEVGLGYKMVGLGYKMVGFGKSWWGQGKRAWGIRWGENIIIKLRVGLKN